MSAPDPRRDEDELEVRKILGHLLRDHVAYQSGKHSEAPSIIFADADYEIGDGTCGLWADGKQANEPAIVYARFDTVVALTARVKDLEALLGRCAGELCEEIEAKYPAYMLEYEHNRAKMRNDMEAVEAARAALKWGEE